jgi:hypothetical protein
LDPKFDLQVGFYDEKSSGRSKYLNFMLASYSIDGEFLGFTELGSELSQCPFSYENVLSMKKFGTITNNTCNFYLYDLLRPETQPD